MTDEQTEVEVEEAAPAAPNYIFALEVTATAEVIKADGTVRD